MYVWAGLSLNIRMPPSPSPTHSQPILQIVGDPKAAANQQALARWLVKACIPDNFWWCVGKRGEGEGRDCLWFGW